MATATSMVGKPRLERNRFNLKYRKLFNCDMGQLIPIQCDLMIPGDVVRYSCDIVTRLQPLAAPILQEISVDTHTFFVPIRIIDEDFEESSSGGEDGQTTKTFPRWELGTGQTAPKFSLWDYFGHPVAQTLGPPWPTDWHRRAYYRVWNEYYRDQHYEDALDETLNTTAGTILYRAFRKDYFTSALPDTQLGTAPGFPISGDASAVSFTGPLLQYLGSVGGVVTQEPNNSAGDWGTGGPDIHLNDIFDGLRLYSQTISNNMLGNAIGNTQYEYTQTTPRRINIPPTNTIAMRPNLSGLGGNFDSNIGIVPNQQFKDWLNQNELTTSGLDASFTVNDLRETVQMQKFMERNMRIGVRYTEQLYGRWRVAPRDERLDRPEYVGGSRSPIIISEVLQTSETTAESPQGNLGGHGLTASVNRTRKYLVKEWGILITLMSIMPKVGYSQGIDRQWLYESRWDLPAPEFTHLGEREIYNTEIYTTGSETNNRDIFGYRGMYDEHRLKHDMVCGDMRDVFDYWHLNRQFTSTPMLNHEFITTENNIRKDIFISQNEPGFIVHVGNKLSMVRSLPAIAEPGLVDHF